MVQRNTYIEVEKAIKEMGQIPFSKYEIHQISGKYYDAVKRIFKQLESDNKIIYLENLRMYRNIEVVENE